MVYLDWYEMFAFGGIMMMPQLNFHLVILKEIDKSYVDLNTQSSFLIR